MPLTIHVMQHLLRLVYLKNVRFTNSNSVGKNAALVPTQFILQTRYVANSGAFYIVSKVRVLLHGKQRIPAIKLIFYLYHFSKNLS